eukprot:279675-Pyramimonas_sp.AAC.1
MCSTIPNSRKTSLAQWISIFDSPETITLTACTGSWARRKKKTEPPSPALPTSTPLGARGGSERSSDPPEGEEQLPRDG